MAIQSHKDLIVWKKSMLLVETIYVLTGQLPDDERYGLVSQMRRSAVSIPSSIAEGNRRRSNADYARFLKVADGSAAELETQLLLVQRLFELNVEVELGLLEEVMKMLAVMIARY